MKFRKDLLKADLQIVLLLTGMIILISLLMFVFIRYHKIGYWMILIFCVSLGVYGLYYFARKRYFKEER